MIAILPSKLYLRILVPLGVIWVCVAFAMMRYYGKVEHAFLWPLQVIGMPVDDFRWDCCQVPDRDGLVTFHEQSFQFRASPQQIAKVIQYSSGETAVQLIVDRREFGALEPPGEPRITCSGSRCTDICGDGWRGCSDIDHGWYRVWVVPISKTFQQSQLLNFGWPFPHPMNLGPRPGTGFRCAQSIYAGLELCWPARLTQKLPIANARDVAFPAFSEATSETRLGATPTGTEVTNGVWVSTSLDANGFPVFVASCATEYTRYINVSDDVGFEVTFHVRELEDWQRFDAGLMSFANRLIKPTEREARP